MDIVQLSKVTGVSSRAIHHYCQLGLVGHTDAEENDAFDEADIHSVKLLNMATNSGFKIRDVIKVVDAKHNGQTDTLYLALNELAQRAELSTDEQDTRALMSLKSELSAFISEA